MMYTWEVVDIVPGRRFWGHNRAENSLSMIGCDASCGEQRYCVFSLADGSIYAKELSKKEVAYWLNRSSSVPDDIRMPDLQKFSGEKP